MVDADELEGWSPAEAGPPPVTPLPPVQPEELPVPLDVEATESAGPPFAIEVSWLDPLRDDLDWRVRYRTSNTEPWSQQTFTDLNAHGGRFTAELYLDPASAYEIQVASISAVGTESTYSTSAYIGQEPAPATGTAQGVGTASATATAASGGKGTATGTGSGHGVT